MKAVITKLNIPDKFDIVGFISPADGSLILDREPDGKITGGRIRLNLECDLTIQGIPMKFKSFVSHTLTNSEMDELMIKFNK